MRLMMAQAAAVLPASMQVPASATTGTPCVSSGASRFERLDRPTRAGTPMRSPRYGKVEHDAEHAAVERLALVAD